MIKNIQQMNKYYKVLKTTIILFNRKYLKRKKTPPKPLQI